MKFTEPLKKNSLFRLLYRHGKSSVKPCLVLYVRKNRKDVNRLGLTVSPKLGNAVVRNRIKRRLRECYRMDEEQFLTGYDMVLVARSRCEHADFERIRKELLDAARECLVQNTEQ